MTEANQPSEKHSWACHPDDDESPKTPKGYEPQETEECWHCHTPTVRGHSCMECWENADDVPPESVYHCTTCGRWWAYMRTRITKITFNPPADNTTTTKDGA